MVTTRDHAASAIDALAELGHRSAVTLADRLGRVRASLLLAVQAGVAAGLAWWIAHGLIGHPQPFFAPVSAVIVLGVSVGQRLRRAFELVIGVALGIFVGDLLIYFIGTGGWQIALGVFMAILTAVFVGGSSTLIGQCASSAVLVATLAPPQRGIYYTRFIDALVGGAVGVLVMALLLPVNPLTTVRRAAAPVLELLTAELEGTADALAGRDSDRARKVLERVRASEPVLARFREALGVAGETASLAPVRWRSRIPLAQYVECSVHVDRAVRNARVLVRRSVSVLEDAEAVPDTLLTCLRTLAGAVATLRRELAAGVEPRRTREAGLEAVGYAADAYRLGLGFSGNVVVAQVRSIATDVMRATGLDEREAIRAVRRAVGRLAT